MAYCIGVAPLETYPDVEIRNGVLALILMYPRAAEEKVLPTVLPLPPDCTVCEATVLVSASIHVTTQLGNLEDEVAA
jgi:hypothetical protein